jgi:hypothetical protein
LNEITSISEYYEIKEDDNITTQPGSNEISEDEDTIETPTNEINNNKLVIPLEIQNNIISFLDTEGIIKYYYNASGPHPCAKIMKDSIRKYGSITGIEYPSINI